MKVYPNQLLIVLSFFIPSVLAAQGKMNFFADTVWQSVCGPANIAKLDKQFLYIGSSAFDTKEQAPNQPIPVLLKLDTAGNTIWTYTPNKEIDSDERNSAGGSAYNDAVFIDIHVDSNDVFVQRYASHAGLLELLSVNNTTGELNWRKEVPDARDIQMANATQLAYSYINDNVYVYELADRTTGKTTFSRSFPSKMNFKNDQDHSVYFFKEDSIFKYDSPLLDKLVWSARIPYNVTITTVDPRDDGYLYFFGDHGNVFAGRVSKSSGTIGWIARSDKMDLNIVSSYQLNNDFIYVAGRHAHVGNVYTAYQLMKIERLSGKVIWDKEYNASGQEQSTLGGAYMGISSIDIDNLGNVFASGFEAANDLGTGRWTVLKFNPAGILEYKNVVSDGTPYPGDDAGILTFVKNNNVFHIGNLNKNGQVQCYLLAADTGKNFQPYTKKPGKAGFQYASTVKSMLTFSSSKYVVFKQTGNRAIVELKNAADNSLIWSKKIGTNVYTAADKLCITADKQIALTTLTHTPYKMKFDYHRKPDSINFIKLDSTGKQVSEKKFYIGDRTDFKSVQLYPSPDTNTVLLFSQVSMYATPMQLHLFNVDKATEKPGTGNGYMRSTYAPVPGQQQLLLPNAKDSTLHFIYFENDPPSTSMAQYGIYTFKTAGYGAGFEQPFFKLTHENFQAHNLIKGDSNAVIILARDYRNQYFVKRYSLSGLNTVWTNALSNGITINMGSLSGGNIYGTGTHDEKLFIQQLRHQDGAENWRKELTPPAANQYYVPLDQQFNKEKQQYVICGYIADTTTFPLKQRPFYLILDAAGKTIDQWTGTPDYQQQNQLNAIAITQSGQTLIGGALYQLAQGRAGVIIEAGKAISSGPEEILTYCEGGNLRMETGITDQSYQWQQYSDNGFVNMLNNEHVSGVDGQVLLLHNIPATWHDARFRCLASNGNSHEFRIKLSDAVAPAISITASDSILTAAATFTFTAQVTNAQTPAYQWKVNGVETGTDNPVFISSTLTDNAKIQVVVTSTGACSRKFITPSNIITMHAAQVSTAVSLSPNPVAGMLILDNLQLADGWQTLEILSLNGERRLVIANVKNQTKLRIQVDKLSPGMYLVVLRGDNGKSSTIRFVKI